MNEKVIKENFANFMFLFVVVFCLMKIVFLGEEFFPLLRSGKLKQCRGTEENKHKLHKIAQRKFLYRFSPLVVFIRQQV